MRVAWSNRHKCSHNLPPEYYEHMMLFSDQRCFIGGSSQMGAFEGAYKAETRLCRDNGTLYMCHNWGLSGLTLRTPPPLLCSRVETFFACTAWSQRKIQILAKKLREICARTFPETPPKCSVRIVQVHPHTSFAQYQNIFGCPCTSFAHIFWNLSGMLRAQVLRNVLVHGLFSKSASVQAINVSTLGHRCTLSPRLLQASHHVALHIIQGALSHLIWGFWSPPRACC